MIAKSLIAAAAVAGSALAFTAADASAKTNFDVHIGLGGFLPTYEVPIYRAPVYIAPQYIYEDDFEPTPPRRYRHNRFVVQYDNGGIGCKRGLRVVRSAGFHNVEAYDCSAPTYGYSAWQDGGLFKVRVTSGGDIISVRQID
jgi:hypothetical protein